MRREGLFSASPTADARNLLKPVGLSMGQECHSAERLLAVSLINNDIVQCEMLRKSKLR